MRSLLMPLAVASLGVSAAAAAPDGDHEPYAYTLNIENADTESGARDVYADIRRQAARLCAFHGRPPRNNARAERACRSEKIAAAVAQVDRPLVTQAHLASMNGD